MTSRVRRRKLGGRPARRAISPYSFMVAPQPAELTTIASRPRPRNARDVLPARARARRALAAVDVQRAAAHLLARDVDLAAVVAQHAQRRGVDRAVHERHDAAGEQADAIARVPSARVDVQLGQERPRQVGQQALGSRSGPGSSPLARTRRRSPERW